MLGGAYYTYLIGLGEFDDFKWGNIAQIYVKCLFVVNTLFIQIILFNLFIAIISESFDHVNQQKKQASLREKAAMISENQSLLKFTEMMEWCPKGMILLYVKQK